MTILSDQKTGVTPEATERAEIIAGLRALAVLLEYVPEVPIQPRISWSLISGDAEDVPALESAAKALAELQVPHRYTVREHSRTIFLELGGLCLSISHVHDAAWQEHLARTSYSDVVQVDADQADAVSA